MTDILSDNNSKSWVVILGGCGFIGRHLVDYLVSNELVSGVRVVDKVPPLTAWLNSKHSCIFEDPIVEFRSANLINEASCAAALEPPPSIETWDLVVNCAGETKAGQTDPVYREGILNLSLNVARECARLHVGRLIEISSGCMYSSEKEPHQEDGPIEPWTFEAKWKALVEEELKKMEPELNYTIIRPALVYGIGDRRGLTPRLLMGGVYKQLGEEMKLLWTGDLRLDTVHVRDLCRAVWQLARLPSARARVYNVVDGARSTQGSISAIVAQIFGIPLDYWGTVASKLIKKELSTVVEEANDKHLGAWAAACSAAGVCNTPLDPSTREELLLCRHLHLDGARLLALGFRCEVERPTRQAFQEILDDFVEMNIFPKTLLS